MNTERNAYLDVVRGFGILLVMFGHLTAFGQPWRMWIYGFHMPLFFLLSGVFVRTDIPFGVFLRKKLRSLYLPFAVFLTVDKMIGVSKLMRTGSTFTSALRESIPPLWAYAGADFRAINLPIWFLFSLLIVQIALFFLAKKPALLVAAAILSAASPFCTRWIEFPCVVLAVNALFLFCFSAAGYLCRVQLRAFDPSVVLQKRAWPVWIAAAGIAAGYAVCVVQNGNVDYLYYHVGTSQILLICCAAAGIVLMLLGCCVLYKWQPLRRALVWYGRNSLILLVTHFYFTRLVIPRLIASLGWSQWRWQPWMEVLLFLALTAFLTPLTAALRRWLYLPLGLPKPRSSHATIPETKT